MAGEADSENDSSSVPIADDCIRDAAAEHPVTTDQVRELLADIQATLETEINSLYEGAWMRGGAQNHLYDTENGVFFGMTPHDLWEELEGDVDWDVFLAACDAHEYQAEKFGFTVDRPTAYANTLKSDYQPVFIKYPEQWLEALYHARMRMMYLLQHDLTPAEALDYWALESGHGRLTTNQSQSRWVASRGVDREAVRKTRRQAKEKVGDEERQPYYAKQDIETAEVSDR